MNEQTKIKSASVKVMLSYDYSHFEASMALENDNGLSMLEIDNARKRTRSNFKGNRNAETVPK